MPNYFGNAPKKCPKCDTILKWKKDKLGIKTAKCKCKCDCPDCLTEQEKSKP